VHTVINGDFLRHRVNVRTSLRKLSESSGVFALFFAKRRNTSLQENMEEAMTNIPSTRSNRPDARPSAAAVLERTAKKQELELAPPGPGGVLKELVLARWRGLTIEGFRRPQREIIKTGDPILSLLNRSDT
jgi:hypothetical protein